MAMRAPGAAAAAVGVRDETMCQDPRRNLGRRADCPSGRAGGAAQATRALAAAQRHETRQRPIRQGDCG